MANGTDSDAGNDTSEESEQSGETSAVHELEAAIREAVAGSSDKVFHAVKEGFVSAEINKRVDLIVQAVEKLRDMAKEIKKTRPDHLIYNENREAIQTGFTKQQLETLNKLKERRAKLVKATNKAINELDYEGLKKALGGGNKE